jgi:hypothetical protein
MHRSKNFAEHAQRVLRRAAEQAGMQVAVGAGEPHLLIDQPAQRRGDRRCLLVPHAGVADQRQVELELVGIVADEIKQVLGAALLFALDHHGDGQRQRAGHSLVGPAGFDKSHSLPLIVAGPAGNDDLAAVGQRLEPGLERRVGPLAERIDWLHVVVTVEQNARFAVRFAVARRCALRFAYDDRMTAGRTNFGLKADAPQIRGDMLGGDAARIFKCRIGGHRLNPQQREQPFETRVEIPIDSLQHRLNLAHRALREDEWALVSGPTHSRTQGRQGKPRVSGAYL